MPENSLDTAPPTDEQGAQQDNSGAPASPAAPLPQSSAPDPAAEEHLAAAEQRATEHAERAEQLQQALNPDGKGEAGQDPAQLAAAVAERDTQLADLAARLRTAQVELAAHRAASDHGARADRLLNSRNFLDSVNGLDPDAPKFGEQLAAAITAAVEVDPDLYRAAPAGPPRGGAEFNGSPSAERRPKNLHDAIAARLGS
ncbi:hypothetical protein [Streptomyces sp. XD-27]|uniref:hypothetical protein n=1 Tax=Streptomyces sp. XD-27 TaxID=3062779 RepID=UPI0026F4404D|nr:hypothetical protein [Streptomyces sp. XD-27]WKX70040.1 hypothetical protein Q3Y56_09070 [Streptomyces sp. XD-27]